MNPSNQMTAIPPNTTAARTHHGAFDGMPPLLTMRRSTGANSGSMELRKNRAMPEKGLTRRVRTAHSVTQTIVTTSAETRKTMRASLIVTSKAARRPVTAEFLSRRHSAASGGSLRDESHWVMFLVTGGAGFIGSALVRALVEDKSASVVNVDKLTYAANPASLADLALDPRYAFEQIDICDGAAVRRVLETYRPSVVLHLAAESHVDRSIDAPADFVQTNLVGTFTLLAEARRYWLGLSPDR